MTRPFPAIFDKDGKYLGDMAPSREVMEYMQDYASRQVRQKFTDWLAYAGPKTRTEQRRRR